jgi:hypothetical protein
LEADLRAAVTWADSNHRRWAFSLSNAGARYAQFRAQLDELDQVDWSAVEARDFRLPDVKEKKQAEFLVFASFPLELVTRIGVRTNAIQSQVQAAFAAIPTRPVVEVRPDWYY